MEAEFVVEENGKFFALGCETFTDAHYVSDNDDDADAAAAAAADTQTCLSCEVALH